MLFKKVIVKVKSRQSINNEEDDQEVIELITPGEFYKKENIYFAAYEETEISGMKGTTTTLKIGSDEVNLIRFGNVNSCLRFKKGIKDVSFYKTQYGVIELVVKVLEIDINIGDNGGDLRLLYELEAGGQQSSTNELCIKIQ